MRRILPFIICFFLPAIFLSAEPDFQAMLREIDDIGNFGEKDFSCIYTIVSEKPGEEKEITQARMFRRDSTDQFLILILKPDVQKGQGYLQVDENVWFYDPESRKFSHSSLKENIQNSDAKNADLNESSLAEDYEVTEWEEGTLGSFPVYILKLRALHDEVTYPELRLWIRKDKALVLKNEDYSLSGRLMRTSYYPKYIQVGDKLLPSQILIVDELREGERTQVTMRDATTADLPDAVFTKAYLERVNN
jgi:outer membrane lipoprotein-sorting protein